MSQQTEMWSTFFAAALANPYVCDENESIDSITETAAKVADFALAEYNKRSESLSKLENELTEQALLLEVRAQQVGIGTQALMVASDLLEAWRRDQNNVDPIWIQKLKQLVDQHLHLVGHTYTTVPFGFRPDDPKVMPRGSR